MDRKYKCFKNLERMSNAFKHEKETHLSDKFIMLKFSYCFPRNLFHDNEKEKCVGVRVISKSSF